MSDDEFSVCQFFHDDTQEYVRRWVGDKEAFKAFVHYSNSVAAKCGIVVRVILTDGGDHTNMEWIYGKGITYPPEAVGKVPDMEKVRNL